MAYLYRHIRHDTNQVFYVGIGSDDNHRRSRQSSGRNNLWNKIVAKTDYSIEIMIDGISRSEALDKEKEFIKLYGRRNTGTGTLVNLTDGGLDNKGFVFGDDIRQKMREASSRRNLTPELRKAFSDAGKNKVFSAETRQKLSDAHKGKTKSESHRLNLSIAKKGFKPSQETRLKLSEARKRRVYTDELRQNISKALKGKKKSESHTKNNTLSNYKLSQEQVMAIPSLRAKGLNYKKIGEMFGTCAQVICNIVNGKTYKLLANG